MENFLEIVKDNYLIFTIVSVILILSLIGYLVDNNVSKDVKIKKNKAKKDTPPEESSVDTI